MRKSLFIIAAVSLVAFFTASTASAQCTFDAPSKAKGLKTDMIKAYVPCGSGITYPATNSASNAGTGTCAPPIAYSEKLFGDKGKCSVKTKAKLESPCATGTPGDCSNVSLQAKCSNLRNADNITPVAGAGWALATITRATINDKSGGDMTVINFPAKFIIPPAEKGKLSLKSDTHFILDLLFGPGNELAACAQLEILRAAINDDNGLPFAVMGTSTR